MHCASDSSSFSSSFPLEILVLSFSSSSSFDLLCDGTLSSFSSLFGDKLSDSLSSSVSGSFLILLLLLIFFMGAQSMLAVSESFPSSRPSSVSDLSFSSSSTLDFLLYGVHSLNSVESMGSASLCGSCTPSSGSAFWSWGLCLRMDTVDNLESVGSVHDSAGNAQ